MLLEGTTFHDAGKSADIFLPIKSGHVARAWQHTCFVLSVSALSLAQPYTRVYPAPNFVSFSQGVSRYCLDHSARVDICPTNVTLQINCDRFRKPTT